MESNFKVTDSQQLAIVSLCITSNTLQHSWDSIYVSVELSFHMIVGISPLPVSHLHIGLGEVALLPVLLPCPSPGEEEVYSLRLEHPLRLQ